jgi:hypothetical protein
MQGYSGSVLYLQDKLGNHYERVALDGAARDGAGGAMGSTFAGD